MDKDKVFEEFLKHVTESDYAGDSTGMENSNGEVLLSIYPDRHEYRIYLNKDGTWKAEIHNG